MNIVFLGGGQFGIDCLDALKGTGHKLPLIVTAPPHRAGRGRKPRPTPVADWARKNNIDFLETENVNTAETVEQIAARNPDLILVIAFGQKIGNQLIALPLKGAINVHASRLPKFRGAAPINHAILKGEKQTGVTIITLAEKMDAGDMLAKAATDIEPTETAGQLHDRLAKLAAPLLMETLDHIEQGSAVYTAQDHSLATLAGKLKKSDGCLDFTEPADILERKIRGLTPWPGAAADYLSKKTNKTCRVTIAAATVIQAPKQTDLKPGNLDENLNVICGRDALKITKIKPASSPMMNFEDFANGRATAPGDLFLKIENKK